MAAFQIKINGFIWFHDFFWPGLFQFSYLFTIKFLKLFFFSGEKPFECKLCHLRFPQRFSCVKHLKSNIHKLSSNDEIQNNIKYHNIGENSSNKTTLKDSKNLLSLHTKLIHSNAGQKESPNLPSHGELKRRKTCNLVGQFTVFHKG